MDSQSKTMPVWTHNIMAFFFLWGGMFLSSKAIAEIQMSHMLADIWALIQSLVLVLFFGLGWNLPLIKLSQSLTKIVIKLILAVILIIDIILLTAFLNEYLDNRFLSYSFIASHMALASGYWFNALVLRQSKTRQQ
jgi:hypothetical protein